MLLILAGLFSSCASKPEQAGEKIAYFTNPILGGWYPDPSITDDGQGNYYMVHSTFAYYPGIPIFKSTDLINWRQIGSVLERPEQLELSGLRVTRGIFAPDISYNNGTFYVTCTLVDGKGNFVVTTTNPAGDWSDPVWLPEVEGIDPGLFFDDNDKAYLVYNSVAPENKPLYSGHRTIRMVEFDKENLKTIGDNRILVNGGVDITKKPIWAEGPRIYKLNGYYYLMTAEGGTAIGHSEVVYRTRDLNSAFVPFEKNPILTQRDLDPNRKTPITSAGHADLIKGKKGDWYGVFLACRDYGDDHYNTGRETFLAPVKWEDDWPVFDLGGEEIKYHYQLPKGVKIDTASFPLNGNFRFVDEFREDSLAYHWMFLRTVHNAWYSLDSGYLTLKTRSETVSGTNNPSFIGHRQQHLICSVSTMLNFEPSNNSEQAGLIAFQNEKHFYYLNKAQKNGHEVVQLMKGTEEGTQALAVQQIGLPDKPVYLKIEADKDKYHFYYASKRGEWQTLLKNVDGTYLSTKVAGGFVGVTLAMYTTSNGDKSTNAAQFDWFEYNGHDQILEIR